MSEDALGTALDAYLLHLRANGYSLTTVETYAFDLRHLHEQAGDVSPGSLNSHDIRRALSNLRVRGLQPKTLARTLSAWRSFFKYLARQEQVSANPCLGVHPPKGEQRLPHVLSIEQVAKLLNPEGDEQHDVWACRDAAMFELMYSSGLRRAELVGLDLGQVDVVEGEVRVIGKGSKTRLVPVGSRARVALQAWLAVRPEVAAAASPALFVGVRGERISPGMLGLALKRRAQRHDVSVPVHPHALRHSFASHVLQSSGNLRAVQEMLGHASLSSTQVYTHLDFQYLARAYEEAHPRAKKKPGEEV